MKKINNTIKWAAVAILGMGTILAMADCDMKENDPSGVACVTGAGNCDSYTTPIPSECSSSWGTGSDFGGSETNTVTATKYSGGSCSGKDPGQNGTCQGGTFVMSWQTQQTSTYCTQCGG